MGCTFVVGLGDGFESVLSSGVPDLHLDFFILNLDCFNFEVYSNGHEMGGYELVVACSQQNVGLAHSRIPYDNHFH